MNKNNKILSDQELLKFQDYEDYLESFITPRDLYHLRSKALSRQIIELGYHTEGTLDRETFESKVQKIQRYLYLVQNPYALCSEFIQPKYILLQELSLREKANRYGEMYTIIFMRHFGKFQSQISAYIDYNQRLKTEDWLPYFENTIKLTPRKSDLSYYNWKSGKSILNKTENFTPTLIDKQGIVFQNNHDLNFLDPSSAFNSRTILNCPLYGPVTLYDYIIQSEAEE